MRARFSGRKRYDLFLTEGPHFPPVLMRKFGLLRRTQRTAALMGNETLYFLESGYYPEKTRNKILWLLRSFDALICVGGMQARLAADLLAGFPAGPRVYETPSAVGSCRAAELSRVTPALAGNGILFIGRGPDGFRSWYKGIDLLMAAFDRALNLQPGLRLEVVGGWDDSEVDRLRRRYPAAAPHATFAGDVDDICGPLSRASLYVHLARGEAFGISVLEAMAAGVPALVSECTGASEAVRRAGEEWVVPTDPSAAADRIAEYFRMPPDERRRLSERSRATASEYTEERAIRIFREIVCDITGLPMEPLDHGAAAPRHSARRPRR